MARAAATAASRILFICFPRRVRVTYERERFDFLSRAGHRFMTTKLAVSQYYSGCCSDFGFDLVRSGDNTELPLLKSFKTEKHFLGQD
jgi:hypothetical protein